MPSHHWTGARLISAEVGKDDDHGDDAIYLPIASAVCTACVGMHRSQSRPRDWTGRSCFCYSNTAVGWKVTVGVGGQQWQRLYTPASACTIIIAPLLRTYHAPPPSSEATVIIYTYSIPLSV